MAYPIELTIGTGNKVTVNYQSQEVSVSLTYQLERGDEDVLVVAKEKVPEVVAVHRAAWEGVQGVKDQVDRTVKPAEKTNGARQEAILVALANPYHDHSVPDNEEETVARDRPLSLGAEASEAIMAQSNLTEAKPVKGPSTEELSAGAKARNYEPSTAGQRLALKALLAQSGTGEEAVESLITRFGCDSIDELSYSQACEWLLELQRAERERVRAARNRLAQPAVLNGQGHG